jgi:hypothetical protein
MKPAFMMRLPAVPSLIAAGLVAVLLAAPARAADETITIPVDTATLIKTPERLSTLVIGNPLVADVSVQAGGILIVTGNGYGATNLVALDKNGAVLLEKTVHVVAARENVVSVYTGISRETYSCGPTCQARITLGDDKDFFNNSIAQAGVRTSQAQAQGNPAK